MKNPVREGDKTVWRVERGGSFALHESNVEVLYRGFEEPSYRDDYNGFRLARTIKKGKK